MKAHFGAAVKPGHVHQFTSGLATVVTAHSGLSQWRAQAHRDVGCWAAPCFSLQMLLASSRRVTFRAAGVSGPE